VLDEQAFGKQMGDVCRMLRNQLDRRAGAAFREWFRVAAGWSVFTELARSDALPDDMLSMFPDGFSKENMVFYAGSFRAEEVTDARFRASSIQKQVQVLDEAIAMLPAEVSEALEALCDKFAVHSKSKSSFWSEVTSRE
jgi:hypothetical protein